MSTKMRYLPKTQKRKQQVKDARGNIVDGVVDVEIEIPDMAVYGLPKHEAGLEFDCDESIAGSLKRWKVAEHVVGKASKPQTFSAGISAVTKSQSTGSGKGAGEDKKG